MKLPQIADSLSVKIDCPYCVQAFWSTRHIDAARHRANPTVVMPASMRVIVWTDDVQSMHIQNVQRQNVPGT